MREMEISARDLGPTSRAIQHPNARLGSGRSVNRVLDNERKPASIFRIFTIRQSLGLNKRPSRLVIGEPEREGVADGRTPRPYDERTCPRG